MHEANLAGYQRLKSDWSGDDKPAPVLPPISGGNVARWIGKEPRELEFAIADLAPLGMVTLLTANGGAGKTLLMQLAGTCIAAGVTFLNKPTMRGAAAGVFAEDPEGVLHLRQHRINEHYGIEYEAIADRLFVQSFFGHDCRLWKEGEPAPFMAQLEAQLAAIADLRLVMLDNAALLFGGDENDRAAVTAFMSALNGMAARLGIAILLATHGSKSQDGTMLRAASGSTAWINASRSVLHLQPGDTEQGPKLTVIKANHAATGEEIPLEWRNLLLVRSGAAPGAFERKAVDQVFLDLLAMLEAEGRPVSDNGRAGNYAPKLFAKRRDGAGYRAADFARAMERLFEERRIEMVGYGRAGDLRRKITACEPPE